MDIQYILNHLGEERDGYHGAVAPPIFQNSNFCFPSVDAMRKGLEVEFEAPFYSRGYNPTVAILRKKLAALENAEDALVFSSGSAAICAAVVSVLKAGDHVVCVQKPYGWTNKLLNELLVRFGVETTMVDGRDPENFLNAVKENTRLFMLESPNSLTFEIQDLSAIARIAKENNIVTIVDSSYNAALFSRPIDHGIDLVAHSASKYFGGHGDIVAGVLCGSKERIQSIFKKEFMTMGSCLSPNDAWLMIRGLRTLDVRLNRSADTGEKVIDFLSDHDRVTKINWPFHPDNPQYALAKQQMSRCGGMCSIEIKADTPADIDRFCDTLKHFVLACSWGGYESIAFPMSVFYSSETLSSELPFNLVRLYFGLEDPDILIEDLRKAFASM